jgi:hypothetical protein
VPPAPARQGAKFAPVTLLELVALFMLAAAGWLLWENLRARETANAAIRDACRTEGLLFLDDTVGLQSIRPVRGESGRLAIRRIYGFEYSDTGNDRRKGTVTLTGDLVSAVYVGPRLAGEGETRH